jgi:hypothetical protein
MFKISAEVKRLKEFLEAAAEHRPGQQISYLEIEETTGVTMNLKGKGYLRNAAQYVGVEYSAIPKYGIEIAGADNGLSIIGGRLARIDSATRRAEKATKNISQRYIANMSDDDRRSVLFLGSVFGAIRASADSYKLLAASRKPIPQLTNTL